MTGVFFELDKKVFSLWLLTRIAWSATNARMYRLRKENFIVPRKPLNLLKSAIPMMMMKSRSALTAITFCQARYHPNELPPD